MYRVIIIEDDPMVASISKQYVELNKYLKVTRLFSNGEEALSYLEEHDVDLIILDLYMPVMNGLTFLHELRKKGHTIDTIMVTAANESKEVKECFSYGVIDYLIKPFEYVRFNHALAKFIEHQLLLSEHATLSQETLDGLFGPENHPVNSSDLLSKGLQQKTLDFIVEYLKQYKTDSLSCDQIAKALNLSKVTVRRYMNYLLEHNYIISDINYSTGGRPSILYKYTR